MRPTRPDINTDPNCNSYCDCNGHAHADRDGNRHANSNSHADRNANTVHREMCTNAKTAPDGSAKTLGLKPNDEIRMSNDEVMTDDK